MQRNSAKNKLKTNQIQLLKHRANLSNIPCNRLYMSCLNGLSKSSNISFKMLLYNSRTQEHNQNGRQTSGSCNNFFPSTG